MVGASQNPTKVGYGVLKSLINGGVFSAPHLKDFDFGKRKIFPVNLKEKEIMGLKSYSSIKDIPGNVDLAIICIPAKFVPQVMSDCAEKGIKGVIIISAGFGEKGKEGKELQKKFLKIAKEAKIRIVGPNCLGILYPPDSLNASFGLTLPLSGKVAFISQSGALLDGIIDWSLKERYGFSALISYGNKADLDAPDFVGWAAKEDSTKVIALYVEGFNDGRYFMEIARETSKIKPIIALKGGRSSSGVRAVISHTGSLAGSFSLYKGVFRQSGVIMADSLTQMFNMAKSLSMQPTMKGNRVAIITNGGGNGIMCADFCEELGINLPLPTPQMIKRLNSTGKMHPAWSQSNPFDIVGDATPERYRIVLEEVMESGLYDGTIVIQTLQTMTDSMANSKIIIRLQKKYGKPVITSFMKGLFTEESINYLESNDIPNYDDVQEAARAMWALIEYGRIKSQ